jgi:hypothetical protein
MHPFWWFVTEVCRASLECQQTSVTSHLQLVRGGFSTRLARKVNSAPGACDHADREARHARIRVAPVDCSLEQSPDNSTDEHARGAAKDRGGDNAA